MFDWFKKPSGKLEKNRKREHVPEPPFRPAQLPPRRADQPSSQKTDITRVEIKHEQFVLSLGGDWLRVPNSDPNQFTFESKTYKTSVILSVMLLQIQKDKLLEVARKVAEVREQAERDSRQGQEIQFGDKWVELRPTEDMAEVAYAAFDDKAIFRFFAFVTQRKILSFWVATETRDNNFSKTLFEELYKGLKFYVP